MYSFTTRLVVAGSRSLPIPPRDRALLVGIGLDLR
jgi:hypothetical protein